MRKLTAIEYMTPGNIGEPTAKIKCVMDDAIISAECCRPKYCRANRGYKEMKDDNGMITIETLCGYDEIMKPKEAE